MGRGRAKAKQTKVARELKYSSPGMDLDRLARDLQTDSPIGVAPTTGHPDVDDDEYSDDDDEDEHAGSAAS